MDEHAKYAFTSATDICKQIIALGTGVLALEITFLKDLAPKLSNTDVWILESSWVLLTFSVLFGLWTLMALTGTVSGNSAPPAASIYQANVRVPMSAQLTSFLFGISLSVLFGIRNV